MRRRQPVAGAPQPAGAAAAERRRGRRERAVARAAGPAPPVDAVASRISALKYQQSRMHLPHP